jgi:hypothetical protein
MLITLRLTIYSETTYASHMSVLTVALTKMHAKDMTPAALFWNRADRPAVLVWYGALWCPGIWPGTYR